MATAKRLTAKTVAPCPPPLKRERGAAALCGELVFVAQLRGLRGWKVCEV